MKSKTKNTSAKTLTCILLMIVFFSCKKEQSAPETSEPSTPPIVLTQIMNAKINGTGWGACKECFVSQKSTLGYYYFLGFDTPYSPFTQILVGFKNYADTFVIGQSPGFAQYKHISGTFFTAKTGTIIVSQLDTASNGDIKRLKGSFSVMTDTINGNSFNITEGNIDYEK